MKKTTVPFPIIDVFAGPGGLGEGFATAEGDRGRRRFNSVLSIEKNEFAQRTLLLRHFLLNFPKNEIPDAYYDYLQERITLEDLYREYEPEFKKALKSAKRLSLGPQTHAIVRDLIESRLAGRKRWVLVGGPPCQAYSLVGRSRMMGDPEFEADERHFLYREYLKIIIDHRPPVFVMENVKGLLSAKMNGSPIINRIVEDLSRPKEALGEKTNGLAYRLHSLTEPERPLGDVDPRLFLVKAEEHGVPQARHRMFIVGVRDDLDITPKQLRRSTGPTVEQTIGNLPPIRSGLTRSDDTATNWNKEIGVLSKVDLLPQLDGSLFAETVAEAIQETLKKMNPPAERASRKYPKGSPSDHTALQWMHDPRLNVLTGHESKAHMASDLRRYLFAAVFAQETGRSPLLVDFPQMLLPEHANVELGRAGRMFADRFRVQMANQVATTITSHISKDGNYFIHYDPMQCRSLTVREAARLQTFPDNYKFEGSKTEQYHQVGNAVPPFLAAQIAEIIGDVLDAVKNEE